MFEFNVRILNIEILKRNYKFDQKCQFYEILSQFEVNPSNTSTSVPKPFLVKSNLNQVE